MKHLNGGFLTAILYELELNESFQVLNAKVFYIMQHFQKIILSLTRE